jgi:hypothetical protein
MMTNGCGYTSYANEIVTHYYFRPEEFEREFGFPLFREEGGRQVPNYELLISDLFCNYYQRMIDEGNPNVISNSGNPNIPYNYDGIYPGSNDGQNDGVGFGNDDGYFADYMRDRSSGEVHISFDEPLPYIGPATNYAGISGGDETVYVYTPGGTTYYSQDDLHPVPTARPHVVVLTGVYTDPSGNSWLIVSSWGDEYLVSPPNGATITIDGNRQTLTSSSTVTTIHWDE